MTSKERMFSAMCCREGDHVPRSFMLFHNLYNACGSDDEFVERWLDLGLDACVRFGHLKRASHKYGMFHPDVTGAELVIRRGWHETTEFWTPVAYRDIVAPALRRESELVRQAGRKYGYIITSAFLPILDDILDTGIELLIGLDPEGGKAPIWRS